MPTKRSPNGLIRAQYASSRDWPAQGGKERGVYLHVADNGAAVPANLRARIFEPFFTTKPEGLGIGVKRASPAIPSRRAPRASSKRLACLGWRSPYAGAGAGAGRAARDRLVAARRAATQPGFARRVIAR
jgi:hypothetical protein